MKFTPNFHRVAKHRQSTSAVLWRPPNTVTRDAHGSKPKAIDGAFPKKRKVRAAILVEKSLYLSVHETS